jgi:ADP-heptose:LPS heptosyltransferase
MKVLIIRLSSIGDIVLTTPIIRCVKQQLPNAEIHFLTKDKFASLLANNKYISTLKLWSSDKEKFTNELKVESYDIVIDLHKNLKTRALQRKHPDIRWISFHKLNIQKWLFVNFKINLLPQKHLIDRYFEALKPLNIVNDGLGIDYFFARDWNVKLSNFNLVSKDYVAIAIGGTYYTKQIPIITILSLIKRLNKTIVLLGGGESDSTKASEIERTLPDYNIVNLCNKLTLDESAFVIKHAASIITGDTGLMHIASAFDTPIHALWGNTNPLFGMYAYRSNKKDTYNYHVPLDCNPCSKLGSNSCPRGHFHCMLKQNTEQVVKNCTLSESAQ